MELEKYIQKIRPLIEAKFKEEYSGHDISHLERTMKMALYIQSKEGGDEIVIGISAFLHDIHRIMQYNLNRYVSPSRFFIRSRIDSKYYGVKSQLKTKNITLYRIS